MPTDNLERVTSLICDVTSGLVEKTLYELFDIFDPLQECLELERLVLIKEKLEKFNLLLIPDLTKGDFNTVRTVIVKRQIQEITFEFAVIEIGQGESDRLEFKSSLLYDYKKVQSNQNLATEEKWSDSVLYSTLKTIAAFLNSGGGVLYLGVADDGTILGIEADFIFNRTRDADTWQLFFREKIKSSFRDGGMINDWVTFSILSSGSKTIARVVVTSRSELSYIHMPDGVRPADSKYRLFRRQGNRTANTDIYELEDFIKSRGEARS